MALYAIHQNTMASDATTIKGARQPSGVWLTSSKLKGTPRTVATEKAAAIFPVARPRRS